MSVSFIAELSPVYCCLVLEAFEQHQFTENTFEGKRNFPEVFILSSWIFSHRFTHYFVATDIHLKTSATCLCEARPHGTTVSRLSVV